MKNSILFLFVALLHFRTNAQITVNYKSRIRDTVEVEKYKPLDNGFSYKELFMAPGSWDIQNLRVAELLKSETIIGVDLVYSDYPKGDDFSELNRKRILQLYMFLPEAFNKPMIEWRIVKQTGVQKTGGLQNYFHGFVVYYRPMPTFYAESKLMEDIIEGRIKPEDSTLLKVFERNPQWKDMLVVCDVTGSMSPYTAQLLLWIKANQELRSMKNIVFFNDDDEKSTNQTQRKDTSGIWIASSGNFKKVMEIALEAMAKGNHIENNMEAVCRAIQEFPKENQKVVMIADNWEDPCDLELVKYLQSQKIPVRIIVCGVSGRFNLNYLEIARATGGSVHTMEEDLVNLASMKDGTTFKIGDIKIMLNQGKFYQVK